MVLLTKDGKRQSFLTLAALSRYTVPIYGNDALSNVHVYSQLNAGTVFSFFILTKATRSGLFVWITTLDCYFTPALPQQLRNNWPPCLRLSTTLTNDSTLDTWPSRLIMNPESHFCWHHQPVEHDECNQALLVSHSSHVYDTATKGYSPL